MNKLFIPALAGLILLQPALRAQEKCPVKFGKVLPADFALPAGSYDSAANAVIIADVGNSEFEGNAQGSFTLVFKRSTRIKVLNKNGFDVATVSIPLYVSGNSAEKVLGLRATTYNLENGKVVETKLEDRSIFVDHQSKNWINEKFTLPGLKEGSIIEYSYTQNSVFIGNLQPWAFQGEYPCLWSEYNVALPNFFQYVTLGQGYLNYDVNTTSSRNVTFHVTLSNGTGSRDDHGDFEDNVVDHRWVIKNAPALKAERFTTTLQNYLQKIEFQLARIAFPNSFPQDRMGSWQSLSKELLESDEFGADLGRNNGWLDEEMKTILKGATDPQQKAEKIFAYVRDNFSCTSASGLYLSAPLKTVYKNKNGNVAELNLLLIAMLHHEKIAADPVILSSRSNGFTHEIYPLLTRFNYVIARATIGSSVFYLDASEHWMGFGRLPSRCYNGHARVVDKDSPIPIYFDADSMTEAKISLVIISNEGKGVLSGRMQSRPGYFESSGIREAVLDKGEKTYLKNLQAGYPTETVLSNLTIDSLKTPELPLTCNYEFEIPMDSTADLIYFNPLLCEATRENPFKAADRKYPVEMPYAMDETYTMTMDVPVGYNVDEVPKSTRVKFNDDEGSFEYLVVQQGDAIQLRSRIKLRKATFTPEDYGPLRDFFAFVVKKQNEQIVFKKKKS